MKLKIVNKSKNEMPAYATQGAAGFDLRANLDAKIVLGPGEIKLIPTGLFMEIPFGYEGQVRTRSGLALKRGLVVLNSPGTVDNGYTGEVKGILFNTNNYPVTITKGMKIAQAVLCPVVNGKWVNLSQQNQIKEKDRADKGFGSTGV